MPDSGSRRAQATLGQARLSLPPAAARLQPRRVEHPPPFPITQHELPTFQGLRSSQQAQDSTLGVSKTLSAFDQQMPSSPTLNARPSHPAPLGETMNVQLPLQSSPTKDRFPPRIKRPIGSEELETDAYGQHVPPSRYSQVTCPQVASTPIRPNMVAKTVGNPPVVQGISLISTRTLPDRFRAVFPYPLFNAVQSKCFDTIYQAGDNFVLSAPTGSGKTAVLELAICRLVNTFPSGDFKIVYQAPTKSLCSERQRDWQSKFAPLGLQCAELTGDTEAAQLRNVQHASIIVTTPEKWDSITRKWKDHQKLMHMVKLFLIDEVHMLKEERGATLEAVVSRMKSVGSDVRFVALSATVPNFQDIAIWLGKDPTSTHLPAARERFGEEFRPVRLQKHVCGYQTGSNDFAFDRALNSKLPEVIAKWSNRKPIMVFCFTRSACVETAKSLATWFATQDPQERYWTSPKNRVTVADKELHNTLSSGVAFHHAGLTIQERSAIEKGYLEGDVNVICCTSTLAVGVNLPCHMIIIKNTVSYHNNTATRCNEYSDLEIMQMLGRAGRPQFDDSAVAVIMTRLQRVPHYEKMITGQEVIESCLHRNLIDHLNAEIGLGTITSISAARDWLTGTFLYVRLKNNPGHYKIDGDTPGRNLDERLETICGKAVTLLSEHDLVATSPSLHCTEFGDAMARYYIQLDTMKNFLALPRGAKVSEILSAISQAAEFKEIRFRAGEKNAYKEINRNNSIKFPIPVNLDTTAHKVSLVIQSVLAGIELQTEDHKQRFEYNTAKSIIFQHAPRLVRCIIDCQLYLEDSVTARNGLMLARSLGAQAWDDSPLHLKQLESVGLVTVRKLVAASINSIEELELAEAHRIEQALSRNPPYGSQLQEKARSFPKLRVSIKMVGEPVVQKGEHVEVKLCAELGCLNEKIPEIFQRRPVYVCLLAETSDGKLLHFARISAKRLGKGQNVAFSAKLVNAGQSIRVYAMCDDLAGTLRHAILKPAVQSTAFPAPEVAGDKNQHRGCVVHATNTSKRPNLARSTQRSTEEPIEEFDDEDIDDADLTRAEEDGFVDIDEFDLTANSTGNNKSVKRKASSAGELKDIWEPQQLPNGKWPCNHPCKDKTSCKHLCCREGLDKRPKPPKTKAKTTDDAPAHEPRQTQLKMPLTKKRNNSQAKESTHEQKLAKSAARASNESKEALELSRLHSRISGNTPRLSTVRNKHARMEEMSSSGSRFKSAISFLDTDKTSRSEQTSDDGNGTCNRDNLSRRMDGVNARLKSNVIPTRADDDDEVQSSDAEMLDFVDVLSNKRQQRESAAIGVGDSITVDAASYQDGHVPHHQPTDELYDDLAGYSHTQARDTADIFSSETLFIGNSSDYAIEGFRPQEKMTGQQSIGESEAVHANELLPPAKRLRTSLRQSSSDVREEAERFEQALPTAEFLAAVADAATAHPDVETSTTQDEMEKWFHDYLGSDLFNYTG